MESSPYTLKTVDRAFGVLRIVMDAETPLSLSEIARQAEISTSNAFRFLKTLEASGHVVRDDIKRYAAVPGGGGEIGLTGGIEILDLISASPDGTLSVAALASGLGVDVPRVERALAKLAHASVVEQASETGAWRLSTGMMRFFRPLMNDHVLARFVRPVMEELGRAYSETISWFVLRGWEQVVVDVVPSPRQIRYVLEKGARQPIYLGAGGKAHLAALPEEDVVAFLEGLEPVRLTSYRLDKAALIDDLRAIRRRGYAVSDGERVEGAVSVAVPVRGPDGRVLGVISMMMPKFRMPSGGLGAVGALLKARADVLFDPPLRTPRGQGEETP